MSGCLNAYVAVVALLTDLRRCHHGKLSEVDEAMFIDHLDKIWDDMSAREREQAERLLSSNVWVCAGHHDEIP